MDNQWISKFDLPSLLLPMETLPIDEIKQFFGSISRPTLKTFCILVLLVRNARTVNFNFLKDDWAAAIEDHRVLPDSHYKKIIRFFNHSQRALLCEGIGLLLVQLFKNQFDTLLLDRTHWRWGEKEINLLTLSILWQGVAVPIAWVSLNKAGNSSQQDRMALFQNVFTLFTLKGKTLLADREFLGEDWFVFLKTQGVHFIVRARSKAYAKEIAREARIGYAEVCEKAAKRTTPLVYSITLKGEKFTFVALKNPNPKAALEDRILFFISDWSPTLATEICATYRQRWKIETLFKHLKSNGFRFDELHLKDDAKIELLVGIVSLSYACTVIKGIEIVQEKPTPLKFYKKTGLKSPAVSIFRIGLAQIKRSFFTLKQFLEFLKFTIHKQKFSDYIKSVQ